MQCMMIGANICIANTKRLAEMAHAAGGVTDPETWEGYETGGTIPKTWQEMETGGTYEKTWQDLET